MGVKIVGVSFDAPAANASWKANEGFEFELWTDDSRALAMAYGAAASSSTAYASRVTVLLDAEGELLLTYAVSAIGTHPSEVLEDCGLLFGG